MSLVTKNVTFSSGATIVASEHNSNFDTIYNSYNGNIENANVKSDAAIANSKLNLANIAQAVQFDGKTVFSEDITFAGETIADLGTVTTADINAGTFDGVVGGTTPAAVTGTTLKADTSLELASGATVTGILDEDDLVTDSATQLATQQSIKAYVDTFSPLTAFVVSSDASWDVPAGVTKVYLTMVGGGGGGGGGKDASTGGGGGSGGSYVVNHPHTVTPLAEIAITIGASGAGGAYQGDGVDGGDTIFDGVTVAGGKKGLSNAQTGGVSLGPNGSGQAAGSAQLASGAGADGAAAGGGGGGTIIGPGGAGSVSDHGVSATANSGAGGGGGDATAATGGDGGTGVCIIMY